MRGRPLPRANFDNYRRVACPNSFIKNLLLFASPALKIDFVTRKINVTVVLLDIDVLKDTGRFLVIIGLCRDPIARGLCQVGAGQTKPPLLEPVKGFRPKDNFRALRSYDPLDCQSYQMRMVKPRTLKQKAFAFLRWRKKNGC
jgi:hypothetical protein